MKIKKKGFTLIELVIVIAVIAILAAILIPTFGKIIDSAKFSADTSSARSMSMLTKDAAINGATYEEQALDTNGNPKVVDGKPVMITYKYNMNEVPQVVKFLKQNGYDLVPTSKNTSYWYNRSTGDVQIAKDTDAFSEENTNAALKPVAKNISLSADSDISLSADLQGNSTTFTQDCLEALLINKPEMVFIDQNITKNPVSKMIDTIYNLPTKAATEASVDLNILPATGISDAQHNSVALKMYQTFEAQKAALISSNVLSGAASSLSYIEQFSPKTAYYVAPTATFSAQGYNGTTVGSVTNFQFLQTVFAPNVKEMVVSPLFENSTMLFASSINIPSTVQKFSDYALTQVAAGTVIILNNSYSHAALPPTAINVGAIVKDNTGVYQISYHYLKVNVTGYNQYGIGYYQYSGNDTSYVYSYSPFAKLTGSLSSASTDINGTNYNDGSQKKIQSIFAVPSFDIFGKTAYDADFIYEQDSSQDLMVPVVNLYMTDFNNLTVFYGSVIAGVNNYRIQELGYIRYITSFYGTSNQGDMFCVSDPTSGVLCSNLNNLIIKAYDIDGSEVIIKNTGDKAVNGYYSAFSQGKTFTRVEVLQREPIYIIDNGIRVHQIIDGVAQYNDTVVFAQFINQTTTQITTDYNSADNKFTATIPAVYTNNAEVYAYYYDNTGAEKSEKLAAVGSSNSFTYINASMPLFNKIVIKKSTGETITQYLTIEKVHDSVLTEITGTTDAPIVKKYFYLNDFVAINDISKAKTYVVTLYYKDGDTAKSVQLFYNATANKYCNLNSADSGTRFEISTGVTLEKIEIKQDGNIILSQNVK